MSLQLENLSKSVGPNLHIDNVSLSLEPGTFNVLLGRTLAGKTTLMRLMAGLEKPSTGRVLMDGRDVTRVPVRKRNVAMVYQQFINYPSLSVYRNIASPLKLARVPDAEIDRRVREVAEILHIEALLDRFPEELSGGQQQRTAMARALVKDAELLLLDEPLVNLDYKLREELRGELRSIFERRKSIVVYATTEPLEALTLGGNCAVLDEGRLVQFGPTVEVYQRPSSIRVAEIFSDPAMNFVEGRIGDGELRLGTAPPVPLPEHLSDLAAGYHRFGMRASHLALTPQSDRDVSFPAIADMTEISGSETFIHVRHNGDAWVAQQPGVHSCSLGEPLQVYVDASLLFAFSSQGQLLAAPSSFPARLRPESF